MEVKEIAVYVGFAMVVLPTLGLVAWVMSMASWAAIIFGVAAVLWVVLAMWLMSLGLEPDTESPEPSND